MRIEDRKIECFLHVDQMFCSRINKLATVELEMQTEIPIILLSCEGSRSFAMLVLW